MSMDKIAILKHAARLALVWPVGARRPEVEEALWPLDGHRLPRRAESTRAVDDGEAYEGNDTEPGKTWQWLPTRWGVRGLTGSTAVVGE